MKLKKVKIIQPIFRKLQKALHRKVFNYRCGETRAHDVSSLAQDFQLDTDENRYYEVTRQEAVEIMSELLATTMTYKSPITPKEEAIHLAQEFVSMYDSQPNNLPVSYFSGSIVSGATFDEGIFIVGPKRSSCLWIEDED
jgi:hypothetical protein